MKKVLITGSTRGLGLELAKAFINELNQVEEVNTEFAKTIMKKVQKTTGVKGKNLFMPVRAILTGNVHGPELVNVIEILGKENLLKRCLLVYDENRGFSLQEHLLLYICLIHIKTPINYLP